tara:strand:- start:2262 stop:2687 length:426 start_codon:yes stop_codon:yes gene_type:complete
MSKSPINHCESEMMHQGGWAKMRTINSPNTTGNKQGIIHNKKMRGTFTMSNSPFKIKEEAYEKSNRKMRSEYKSETGKTLGSRQTSGTGSRRVSFACRFAGMDGSMTSDNGEPSKLAMALKKWGFSSKGEARAFCSKNKKS